MDELAFRCKQQLETFRIKELKDVLSRMGAAKQGKKQVLQEKIMAVVLTPERLQHCRKGLKPESVVSRDEVAKVIDDIYRKMHDPAATDLATVVENAPAHAYRSIHPENEGFYRIRAKTRCPCGSSVDLADMITCGSPKCMVQQHINCVIIPENEGMEQEIPATFYCETCRIQYGDPFSVAVAHPLLPTNVITSIAGSEGLSPSQNVEKSFMLSRSEQEMLGNSNFDLQVWCVLLNDKVKFRMHWPLHAQLHVNGFPVPVITNRPGQQSLGLNGRDDGVGIAKYTSEGVNRISLSAHDGRFFCVGIRIIHRLTVGQVLSAVPSEMQGESFDAALARVRRFLGGGGCNDADSDSDLEIISEWVTVNLRCPIGGSRINIAGRFRPCKHMGCFDLQTFVKINQMVRKWQCPICMKNYSLDGLIIDPFFTRITRSMKSYGEDVTEVEMKPDGCWRPKLEGGAKLLESWRSPDDLTSSENGGNLCMDFNGALKEVKIEEGLAAEMVPLKIGGQKTWDEPWQVNGTLGFSDSANNIMPGWNQMPLNMTTPVTSNAAASNDEDPSIGQDRIEIINQSKGDDIEVISTSLDLPKNVWFSEPPSGASGYPETPVIVLSDREGDNANEYSLRASYCGSLTNSQFTVPVVEETQTSDRGPSVMFGTGFTHIGPETDLSFTDMDCYREKLVNTFDFFGPQKGASATSLENDNFWSSEVQCASCEILDSISGVSREAPSSCYQLACPAPVQADLGPACDVSSQQRSTSSVSELTFLGCNRSNESFVTHLYLGDAIDDAKGFTLTDPSLHLFLPDQARVSARPSLMACSQSLQDSRFALSLGGCEFIASSPSTVVPFCDVEEPSEAPGQVDSIFGSASDLLGLRNPGGHVTPGDSSAQRRTTSNSEHRFA